jgi:hypothetical protein
VATIPLTLQTLYADLVQQAHSAPAERGTIYKQNVKGIDYLYARANVGSARRDRFLGRADDPRAQARAASAREEARRARERRNTVRILRAQGVPGPTTELGRVLDALADAELFKQAVLVGTAAYQCYSAIVGIVLPASSLMTQDADLARATLAIAAGESGETLETILKRADKSFRAVPGLHRAAPPSHFRSASGFLVDLLTPQRRRTDSNPMPLKALAAGATPVQQLGWLIETPIPAAALHGAGVPVRVPQPARYAAHKLIVAQKRRTDAGKRRKDLLQAKALIDALRSADPWALADALADARSRGRDGWRRPLDRSLRELGLERDALEAEGQE